MQLLSTFLDHEPSEERKAFIWDLLEASVVDKDRVVALIIINKMCSREMLAGQDVPRPPKHVLMVLEDVMKDLLSLMVQLLKVYDDLSDGCDAASCCCHGCFRWHYGR